MNPHITATWLVFCLILCHQQCRAVLPVLAVKEAYNTAMFIYSGVDSILATKERLEAEEISEGEKKILNKLEQLSTDLDKVKQEITSKIDKSLSDKLTQKVDKLFEYVNDIQLHYKNFLFLFKDSNITISSEIVNFVKVATNYDIQSMRIVGLKLHKELAEEDLRKESIVNIIANSEAGEFMCSRGQTNQQLINTLYKLVQDSTIKILVMMLHSYDVLAKKQVAKGSSYEYLKNKIKDTFLNSLIETSNSIRTEFKTASRAFWRCDPKKHQKGVTYTKLDPVFQGYVFKKEELTEVYGNPFNSCEELGGLKITCKYASCKNQPTRCNGKLVSCSTIDDDVTLCHADYYGTKRRYEYLKLESDGEIYGRKNGKCKNEQYIEATWLNKPCLCDCIKEEGGMSRHFSLYQSYSKSELNRVVVGARIVLENHIFSIQIQDATLGPNGTIIDEPQWRWIDPNEVQRHGFHSVTYDSDLAYLDNLNADSNHALVGLGFAVQDGFVCLQIWSLPFDFKTGKLKGGLKKKINKSSKNNRERVKYYYPDDPTQSGKVSNSYSSHNQLVEFRMSDMRRDLAQNTIPYIDIQPVTQVSPIPLSGAGLFHKGAERSGGFVALKLFHYDYTVYL